MTAQQEPVAALAASAPPVDTSPMYKALIEARLALLAVNSFASQVAIGLIDKVLNAAPDDASAPALQAGQGESGWSNAQLDAMLTDALKERDHCEDMADQLAAQIAAITGEEIGEHSSGNDPWRNAMLAADEFIAAQLRKLLTPPTHERAAPAPEHGQLDPRSALDQARNMLRYVESFNGQKFDPTFDEPDRRNLAVALDHLMDTAAMLLNMADRVAEPAREAVEARQQAYRHGYEQGWGDRANGSNHAFLASPSQPVAAEGVKS